MTPKEKKGIHERASVLGFNAPLGVPVTVRLVAMKGEDDDLCGWTKLAGGRISIKLNSESTYQECIDSLAHEWAHARVFCMGFGHGEIWGQEYATAYRIVEEVE